MTFGEFIRKKRNSQGKTLKEVAKDVGISYSFLSQIENGDRGIPKPDTLRKISNSLDIPYIELMDKAGYITTETDSLAEAFGLTPGEIKELEEGGVIVRDKGIHVDKVYLDYILRDNKIDIYYEGEIIPKNEKKDIDQLIRIYLKRR